MILGIDTTGQEAYLALFSGEKKYEREWPSNQNLSEDLLSSLQNLLKESKSELSDLKGIVIMTGPGSFTSIRSGIVTANLLAWSLKLPIVGYKRGRIPVSKLVQKTEKIFEKEKIFKRPVQPYYKYKAKITLSKKKIA